MKILFRSEKTVDCTSDPHNVSFGSLRQMYEKIREVVESDLVRKIEYVKIRGIKDERDEQGRVIDTIYESDRYTTLEKEDQEPASGEFARKHKVDGLYFARDAEVDAEHHLPPGLTGVKEAIKVILNDLYPRREELREEYERVYLYIPLMWDRFGAINCSDKIEVDNIFVPIVNFCNQDWYIQEDGYYEFLGELAEVLGVSPISLRETEGRGVTQKVQAPSW